MGLLDFFALAHVDKPQWSTHETIFHDYDMLAAPEGWVYGAD